MIVFRNEKLVFDKIIIRKVEKRAKFPSTSQNGTASNGVASDDVFPSTSAKSTHSQEVQTEEPPVKALKK